MITGSIWWVPSSTDDKPLDRVIVTGSREFDNPTFLWQRLNAYRSSVRATTLTVVWGDYHRGADHYVRDWCRANVSRGIVPRPYPADWTLLRRAAGPIRNTHMVKDGADDTLGFLQRGARNSGTRNCLELASVARIRVCAYWSDGVTEPICGCSHLQLFHTRETMLPLPSCFICQCPGFIVRERAV